MISPGTGLQPEIVERLRLGLRIIALQALGDREAAEEAVQETLVRIAQVVWDQRRQNPENLGSYARGVVRHVISDTVEDRRRSVPLDAVSHRRELSSQEEPLSLLVAKEERRRVRRALKDLPSSDRDLLRLCFFEGLGPSEIAAQLGEPAPRIRKRKSRALKRLKKALLTGGMAQC